jgi:putative spermidine/putrescine transport system ATP-binding protein
MTETGIDAATRIAIVDCAKTYAEGALALQRTTLTIEPGEVLALLGPSGCGKTTLLRIVAGFIPPDPGGVIRFNDDDVTTRAIETRGVGMVFQHYALFPQMSVEANIGYGLRIRKLDKTQIAQRVGELIDLVRLRGLEKRRPSELSGGQRQRVALARAVAVRPRVLLLDEPLTALDAKLKTSLRDELAQLLRRLHITTVHVTHDQQEAMAIADRLAVMSAGRVMQVGDPETLYRNPSHPFVAEFLGRVNRLERSTDDRRQAVLRFGGATLPCPTHLKECTSLFLRPEDVIIHPATGGLSGEVTRRVFLGDRVQLLIRDQNAQLLWCDVPKDVGYSPGTRVALSCDVRHLMAAADIERQA